MVHADVTGCAGSTALSTSASAMWVIRHGQMLSLIKER